MKQRLIYTLALFLMAVLTFAQSNVKYEYDEINRLTKVTYSNGTVVEYTYDALGNRTEKEVTGGSEYVDPDAEAYAWLSTDGKTLTFCYDSKRTEREGTTYDLNDGEGVSPGWAPSIYDDDPSLVETVAFNPSFANARPVYTCYWFVNIKKIKTIEGLSYLNTSNVKDMACMFYGCSGLTVLDLTHFDTSHVTNMCEMFEGCSALESIDLSSFNTSAVTDFAFMFKKCSSLKSLELGNFDVSNAERTDYMFAQCKSLKKLDVSHFDISDDTSTSYMFFMCSSLSSLSISTTMSNLENSACYEVGNDNPCTLIAPDGFDFGVDTSVGTFFWKGGYFTLKHEQKIGDANGDGTVDASDVIAILNYILNKPSETFNFNVADVNGDGAVNLADIVGISNIILGNRTAARQ